MVKVNIKENIPLAPHTIYRIGGPARFFTEVKNEEELVEALEWAVQNGISFFTPHLSSAGNYLREAQPTKGAGFILGAGSNILVSDSGFPGFVIHLKDGSVEVGEERLIAGAGVMMARAVLASAKAGLTGFEWGIGVPGTVGGSVRGNAGCFGGEMKDAVESVRIFDVKTNQVYPLSAGECEFGYRDSVFKRHPERIIISATLKLQRGEPQKIQEKIKKIIAERSIKQDIGTKSCGCIFKNTSWDKIAADKENLIVRFPELGEFQDRPNIPSSFLLDKTGLKGKRIGRVFISPKHANFFVNEGGASSEEVRQLIELAKTKVEKKYGLRLEEEIQYVGQFSKTCFFLRKSV